MGKLKVLSKFITSAFVACGIFMLTGVTAHAETITIDGVNYDADAATDSAEDSVNGIAAYYYSDSHTTVVTGSGALTNTFFSSYVSSHQTTNLVLSDEVTGMDGNMFEFNEDLQSVRLPSGWTEIPQNAFAKAYGLSSVSLPSSLTYINKYAFKSCTSLRSISIPSDVMYIGDSAFSSCSNLETITLPDTLTKINKGTFSGCTALDFTSLPSSLTEIGGEAFKGCESLTLTSLPAGITKIGRQAFSNCAALALTSLPSVITEVGDDAFYSCECLALTELPSGLAIIGSSAFCGCEGITEITYAGGENLEILGENAFKLWWGPVATTVATNSDLLKSYDWAGSNREVTFGTLPSGGGTSGGGETSGGARLGDGSGNVPVEAEVTSKYTVTLPATVELNPKTDLSGYFGQFAYVVKVSLLADNDAIVVVPANNIYESDAKGNDLASLAYNTFDLVGTNGTVTARIKVTDDNGNADNGVVRFLSTNFYRGAGNHEGLFAGNSNSEYTSYGYVDTDFLASGDYSGVVDFSWKKVAMD